MEAICTSSPKLVGRGNARRPGACEPSAGHTGALPTMRTRWPSIKACDGPHGLHHLRVPFMLHGDVYPHNQFRPVSARERPGVARKKTPLRRAMQSRPSLLHIQAARTNAGSSLLYALPYVRNKASAMSRMDCCSWTGMGTGNRGNHHVHMGTPGGKRVGSKRAIGNTPVCLASWHERFKRPYSPVR